MSRLIEIEEKARIYNDNDDLINQLIIVNIIIIITINN